jgi:hypothetical protein
VHKISVSDKLGPVEKLATSLENLTQRNTKKNKKKEMQSMPKD